MDAIASILISHGFGNSDENLGIVDHFVGRFVSLVVGSVGNGGALGSDEPLLPLVQNKR
jgi:hypothetical protein